MNRRDFLKRIAAVAAGAVVVPTVARSLPFKPNPAQRLIIGEHDKYIGVPKWLAESHKPYGGKYVVLPCLHETRKGEPGNRAICRSCGRHYTFMKRGAVC